MKVHFLTDAQDENVQILQSRLNKQIHLSAGLTIPQKPDFEVLVAGRPTEDQLAASSGLHSLVVPFAGLSEQTRLLCLQNPDIKVYNLHHNALITAELALALLFSAAKFGYSTISSCAVTIGRCVIRNRRLQFYFPERR